MIQAHAARLGGIFINIGNKNGDRQPAVRNLGTPLASSPKLRQAFEEAIDRNALNRVVFGGLDAAELHADLAGRTPLVRRDQGPVHAVRPGGREEARRRVGLPEPDRAPAGGGTRPTVRLAQFIQAQEAAVGINVVIDSADNADRCSHGGQAGTSTPLSERPVPGNPDPNATSTPTSRPRVEELQRLLEPAARLDPRQRAQGDEPQGAGDALPRGAADRPRRPPDHRPLPPDHVRGLQHERHRAYELTLRRARARRERRSSSSS